VKIRLVNTLGNDGKSIIIIPTIEFWWFQKDHCLSFVWLFFEIEFWFGDEG
jgi:hypothetical protein